MCNLSDLIEERGIEKGIEQGKLTTLIALVQDGLISIAEAAKRVDMTVGDLQKLITD